MSPATRPAERRPASTRYVVVVFPEVPVTPMTRSRSDGLPYTAAATCTQHGPRLRMDQHRHPQRASTAFCDAVPVCQHRYRAAGDRIGGVPGTVGGGTR